MTNLQVTREIPATNRSAAIASLGAFLSAYLQGSALEVIVRKRTATRSNAQNRALFGVAYPALREQSGNDVDDLHTYFCGEYFGWTDYTVMDAHRRRPRRTTTTDEEGNRDVLDKLEFADFYEFIQRRAAENGYSVPEPDPMHYVREEA